MIKGSGICSRALLYFKVFFKPFFSSRQYSSQHIFAFFTCGASLLCRELHPRHLWVDDVGRPEQSFHQLQLLDRPAKISQSGSDLAKYSYLANGSKSKAENGSGVGLVYRGSLIYRKAADGSLTLEGANLPEGRLTVNGVRWHVKDHLGSVRAVVDGSTGNLLAVTDYDAYGEDAANSTASPYLSPAPSGETFRERFTGKEDQGPDFGTAYTDFGARQYSPTLRRWLVPDPLSEKYYGMSPYAYCAGNPVNLVDPDGCVFTERSWQYVLDYLENIISNYKVAEEKRKQYQSLLDIGGHSLKWTQKLNSQIAEQENIMSEMMLAGIEVWSLSRSSQVYDVFQDKSIQSIADSGSELFGVTVFDVNSGTVQIKLNDTSVATISHELKHAIQFEQGKTGFGRDGMGTPYLHDYSDEVEAIRRGSFFSGVSSPSSFYDNYPKKDKSLSPFLKPEILQIKADQLNIIFRLHGRTYKGKGISNQ
jgi:RHS repeat-associated protein